MSESNYYEVLGVSQNASHDEIKKTFRTRAKQCHPDQADGMSREEAKREFIRVRRAFDVLGDPENREAYDDGRSHGAGGSDEQYEEEWENFNRNPEKVIASVLRAVAIAGEELAKEGLSIFGYMLKYAFTYGLLLAIPFSALIFFLAPGDAPEEVQGFFAFVSVVLGLGWGVVTGGFWGLFAHMYYES